MAHDKQERVEGLQTLLAFAHIIPGGDQQIAYLQAIEVVGRNDELEEAFKIHGEILSNAQRKAENQRGSGEDRGSGGDPAASEPTAMGDVPGDLETPEGAK